MTTELEKLTANIERSRTDSDMKIAIIVTDIVDEGRELIAAMDEKGYNCLINDETWLEHEPAIMILGPGYAKGKLIPLTFTAMANGARIVKITQADITPGILASCVIPEEDRITVEDLDNVDNSPEEKLLHVEDMPDNIRERAERLKGPNAVEVGVSIHEYIERSLERCQTCGHVQIECSLPDANVQAELCLACVSDYIYGDYTPGEPGDVMKHEAMRRTILAGFIAAQGIKLPIPQKLEGKSEGHDFKFKANAPSTDTVQ